MKNVNLLISLLYNRPPSFSHGHFFLPPSSYGQNIRDESIQWEGIISKVTCTSSFPSFHMSIIQANLLSFRLRSHFLKSHSKMVSSRHDYASNRGIAILPSHHQSFSYEIETALSKFSKATFQWYGFFLFV